MLPGFSFVRLDLAVLPEREAKNVESWKSLETWVEQTAQTRSDLAHWRCLAKEFLREGARLGLDRYFLAGQSHLHLVFSTLERQPHRLGERRVSLEFLSQTKIRICYGMGSSHGKGVQELEYTLPSELAFPTFRRFLNQLWTSTMPEPVPSELRGFPAPILPLNTHHSSKPV